MILIKQQPSSKKLGRKPKTTKQFVLESNLVYNNKYNYDKVTYTTNATKVTIGCPLHGDFIQSPQKHLRGHGCQKCSSRIRWTTETFITKAKEVHKNFYNYDKVEYTGALNKITITCPFHGDFDQEASSHLRGTKCPSCTYRVSSGEMLWLDSLNIKTLIRQHKIKIPGNKAKEVDGYDPKTNTVYLYHGDYWHGNPSKYSSDFFNPSAKKTMGELYDRTTKYETQLNELGYSVITMWEEDWKLIQNNSTKIKQ